MLERPHKASHVPRVGDGRFHRLLGKLCLPDDHLLKVTSRRAAAQHFGHVSQRCRDKLMLPGGDSAEAAKPIPSHRRKVVLLNAHDEYRRV
jgi:hypothetical protein